MSKTAFLVAAILAAVLASGAGGQELYPVKPVRIIVAAGPGGGDDFTARQIAAKLAERYEDWSMIFGKIAKEAGIRPH